jgi:GTPase SAR1 family protein
MPLSWVIGGDIDMNFRFLELEASSIKPDEPSKWANVFILCFSLDDRATFENARGKWAEWLKRVCPRTPFILAGLKADLRDGPPCDSVKGESLMTEELVDSEEALAAARSIGAVAYAECSAWTDKGAAELTEAAVRASMMPYNGRSRGCVIL